jgi:3-hydroxyisobutyrate dehydrogenase-like beta-hydroxyacid dehydrogenase
VIAGNALVAGFELMVYDLRTEPLERLRARGAKVATSARELGAFADILECSIAGDERIESAVCGQPGGALEGMRPGSVIALHSTMNPTAVRRINERARTVGVDVVDAQVTGGHHGAQARTLTMMVGGDAAVLECCRPLFEASCKRIYHMGPVGCGAGAKLAQQMMTVMNLVGVSEALRLAAALELDRDRFLELVENSTGQSSVASDWLQRWAGSPQSAAEGLHLGMVPALAAARDAGVAIPFTALAQQLILDAFRD